jgi:DNA-binding CsgD family transcriptional regulator
MSNKINRRERATRSAAYQSLFCESSFPIELLESFSNEDSLYKKLNPFDYNENILLLEEQLRDEFWRLVNTQLTPRQREIIHLLSQGKTQCEVAKELNINQSSITKSINGNVDYKKGKIVYGGSKSRIRKLIEEDERIQSILQKIYDLRNESWF